MPKILTSVLDWRQVGQFVERKFRRSRSLHTKRYYEAGVRRFRRFTESESVENIDDQNIYDVLDSFVGWLDGQGVKPKTLSGYVHAARKFLGFLDIRIDTTRFREKVELPKILKIDDEPLSMETVRKVVSIGRPNRKMLALILVLLSSGMRLGEALKLRVSDLNLDSSPASATIRAEHIKTGRARVVFMTDEARDAVKKVLWDWDPAPRAQRAKLVPATPDRLGTSHAMIKRKYIPSINCVDCD